MVTTSRVLHHQGGRTVHKAVRNFILPEGKKKNDDDEEEEEVKKQPLSILKAQTIKNKPSWVMVQNRNQQNEDGEEQFLSLLEEDMEFSPESSVEQQQPSNQQESQQNLNETANSSMEKYSSEEDPQYFVFSEDEDQKLIDLRERLIECYLHDV